MDYYCIYKKDQIDLPINAIDNRVYGFLVVEREIFDDRVFDDPFDNACRGFKIEIIGALLGMSKINYRVKKNGEKYVLIKEENFDVENDDLIPETELTIIDVLEQEQVEYLDRSIEKLFRTPRMNSKVPDETIW